MMKMTRMTLSVAGVLAGMGLAACVQQQAPEQVATLEQAVEAPQKTVQLAASIQTIKPGASVSFSHDIAGATEAGENGSVAITLNEGYPIGTMNVEASGSKGLEVFGAESSMRLEMQGQTTHGMTVNYRAEQDGLYYLNLLATADPEEGVSESRAYSVRIEVGDWKAAEAKVAKVLPEALESGEMAVMMEAEETIE